MASIPKESCAIIWLYQRLEHHPSAVSHNLNRAHYNRIICSSNNPKEKLEVRWTELWCDSDMFYHTSQERPLPINSVQRLQLTYTFTLGCQIRTVRRHLGIKFTMWDKARVYWCNWKEGENTNTFWQACCLTWEMIVQRYIKIRWILAVNLASLKCSAYRSDVDNSLEFENWLTNYVALGNLTYSPCVWISSFTK
jgi:hypothetical protein